MEISALSPSTLHTLAINAALSANWDEALKLNQQIIDTDPKNIDALNRTAKAYFELGKLSLAKKYYSEALEVDPYNPIAQKNLKIIQSFKNVDTNKLAAKKLANGTNPPNGSGTDLSRMRLLSSLFLQEPGRTKLVNLLKVAEPQKLSLSYPGMPLEMVIKNHKITIMDQVNTYLGILPDDLSHRLLKLLKGGNKYQAYIKSVRPNGLTVLIRESFRSKKFKNQPSFPEQQSSSNNTTIISTLTASGSSEDNNQSETEEVI